MVFDNASCPEVRNYLLDMHREGSIDLLTLSDQNLGKVGAWNYIIGAAPGKYLAYADADVYHYPGWLAPLVEALDLFPELGMITGMPILQKEEIASATVAWAESSPEADIERGQLLPWEDFWRHTGTLGRSQEEGHAFYDQNPIVRVRARGKVFYASASHFQFVSRKDVLQQVFPLTADRPMGQVRQFDEAINRLGYLRFSTPEWHVRHIGNTLPDNALDFEGIPIAQPLQKDAEQHKNRLVWDRPIVQKVLRWIYGRIFKILYRQ
jgi:glycosyltransferase involved in cell wall biosynthesis